MQTKQSDRLNRSHQFLRRTLVVVSTIVLATGLTATAEEQDQCSAEATAIACCPIAADKGCPAAELAPAPRAASAAQLKDKWGIEIDSLRLSAQGYFVDFRYKVIDPDKASPLANHEWKPYLIDQATGNKLPVPTTPKLGPLRQTAQRLAAGRVYFIFFGNSRGIVKAGAKVTVVIGDCRIENLTVE